jgi:hypothetical protein
MEVKVSRNSAVDFAPMKNEGVLFQPKTNQFCLLNGTATFVWSLLDQPHSVSELAKTLCDHFDSVSLVEAKCDVEKMVEQLLSLECLVSSQA